MNCWRWSLCLVCLSFVLFPVPPAGAGPLPDSVGPWLGASEDAVPFKTVSEDLGIWHNRVYTRSAPSARATAILMEGAGPGTLRVPAGDVSADDFPIGFGAHYRTLEVAGHRAVLERQDLLGLALAIELGKNRTLTLESVTTPQEELLELAEGLVSSLKGK